MNSDAVVRLIGELLGEYGCLTQSSDRQPYESGARYGAGIAACIARPASVQEVAELIRLCATESVRIVTQGANTGLVGAASPDASGTQVILSMDRLKGIVEIDPVDRVAQAYAGTRLSDLNQALALHNLTFPIDLGADPSIGGMLATNTGGARLIRYGDVRSNVLGLEAVLMQPPGQRVNLNNRLRKNNTGPDWKQFFIGTGGAYGVVTQAVLHAHPLPQQCATALVAPASLEAALMLLHDAEHQFSDFLTAFEGISQNAMQAVLRHMPQIKAPFSPLPPYAFLIELTAAAPRSRHFDLGQLFEAWLESVFGTLIADAVIDKPAQLWQLRHAISECIRQEGELVAFDIAVPRSRLVAFRTDAIALIERDYSGVEVFDFGHWGDGGIHFNLVIPARFKSDFTAGRIAAMRTGIYDLAVHRHAGSFSAEHGIGPFNQQFYDRYTMPEQQSLAAMMKAGMDPDNLLGSTRFTSPN
jgi:FAD/FMN-containing dehydrogenase